MLLHHLLAQIVEDRRLVIHDEWMQYRLLGKKTNKNSVPIFVFLLVNVKKDSKNLTLRWWWFLHQEWKEVQKGPLRTRSDRTKENQNQDSEGICRKCRR
jgi:hypothetical protein